MLGPDTEYDVADADPHITESGAQAVVVLLTDKGPVGLNMRREVLEKLVEQARSELSRVAPPSPVQRGV